MHNPYRGGTADVWYSGPDGDLWIEYKYVEKLPRSEAIRPDLTPLQKRWLNARHDEGRTVAVILGTPDGGVIYQDKDWSIPQSTEQLEARMVTLRELAKWITSKTGVT